MRSCKASIGITMKIAILSRFVKMNPPQNNHSHCHAIRGQTHNFFPHIPLTLKIKTRRSIKCRKEANPSSHDQRASLATLNSQDEGSRRNKERRNDSSIDLLLY